MKELANINLVFDSPSKENIKRASEAIIFSAMDGHADPIGLCVKLAAIEKICQQVREGVQSLVLSDLDKFPKGETTLFDAKIQRKETGVSYDYSLTPKWVELKAMEDDVAEQRKALEGVLKTIKTKLMQVDEKSGETLEYIPAAKTSKTSFAITLGK